MRRLAALVAVLACPFAVSAPAEAASWARDEIRAAVQSGLMGPSVQRFRPDVALTRAELAEIVAGVTQEAQTVTDPERAVTMTELNRTLVRALGLGPAGEAVRRELAASGLTPPRRAGWETVARFLGLRYNHPAASDFRELLPTDRATRAEAAYSVAQLLELSSWELERADDLATSFDLPELGEWERRVLQRGVRFVGFPYVWGGMSESRQTLFGVPSRGGFDCSGFVWRVFKLEPFTGGARLAATLRGRTTFQMSAEMPRRARIRWAGLRPADVIFFGSRGPSSAPAEITHAGIAMGNGWFVHSSGNGTTIARLEGWYQSRYAWARRPLREAGLL